MEYYRLQVRVDEGGNFSPYSDAPELNPENFRTSLDFAMFKARESMTPSSNCCVS